MVTFQESKLLTTFTVKTLRLTINKFHRKHFFPKYFTRRSFTEEQNRTQGNLRSFENFREWLVQNRFAGKNYCECRNNRSWYQIYNFFEYSTDPFTFNNIIRPGFQHTEFPLKKREHDNNFFSETQLSKFEDWSGYLFPIMN